MAELPVEEAPRLATNRCPYPRPFKWYFGDCPAFMPRLHLATDIRGRPLQAHWTCAHLVSARHETGGFYPGCLLGTAAERALWAGRRKGERLAAIRLARIELSQAIRSPLEKVRNAIGNPYDAFDSRRRSDVRGAWAGLAAAFDDFVIANPGLFEAAGIEADALRQCFTEAMAEFATRPPGRRWQMSAEVVGRYPWAIQAFFRPDLVRETTADPD
jgi:hypothetical protein